MHYQASLWILHVHIGLFSLQHKKSSLQPFVITWFEKLLSLLEHYLEHYLEHLIFTHFSSHLQFLPQKDFGSNCSDYQTEEKNVSFFYLSPNIMQQVWSMFQICINCHYTEGVNRKSYLTSSLFTYPWNILVMLLLGKQNLIVWSLYRSP